MPVNVLDLIGWAYEQAKMHALIPSHLVEKSVRLLVPSSKLSTKVCVPLYSSIKLTYITSDSSIAGKYGLNLKTIKLQGNN